MCAGYAYKDSFAHPKPASVFKTYKGGACLQQTCSNRLTCVHFTPLDWVHGRRARYPPHRRGAGIPSRTAASCLWPHNRTMGGLMRWSSFVDCLR